MLEVLQNGEKNVSNIVVGTGNSILSLKASDEIKTVRWVTKDGGSYALKCPHCSRFMAIEGDDLSEVRGQQYQDRVCGGWLEVDSNAIFLGIYLIKENSRVERADHKLAG